jgi:hypothetical protein
MTRTETPVPVAQAWQDAVNAQDEARLIELSHPEIEIVGPRGVARGHEVLLLWLGRAGLSLETKRIFAGEESVVFAQHGVWHTPETGVVQGEAEVFTSFRIAGGQVTELARYDTLAEALGRAGLSEADEGS